MRTLNALCTYLNWWSILFKRVYSIYAMNTPPTITSSLPLSFQAIQALIFTYFAFVNESVPSWSPLFEDKYGEMKSEGYCPIWVQTKVLSICTDRRCSICKLMEQFVAIAADRGSALFSELQNWVTLTWRAAKLKARCVSSSLLISSIWRLSVPSQKVPGWKVWLGQWGHNEIFYLNLTEYLGNSLLHSFWLILIIMLKQKQNICYCYFIAHTFIN